ncbi:hypothetical protein G5714_020633 [Onychostoma macrolepis]|uniref:Uncharacterized protein n=1 Tax=Onychostoma macrolepis TaxID=369639 RepID=A0A7J6BVR7_9TELE|nr:hypothetical protein G5714_020633 [Onychostoma macrolepis]
MKYSMTGVNTRSKAHERLTLQPDSLDEDELEERGEHVGAFPMIQVAGPDRTASVNFKRAWITPDEDHWYNVSCDSEELQFGNGSLLQIGRLDNLGPGLPP